MARIPRRPRRTWPQRFLFLAAGVLILASLAGAGALTFAEQQLDSLLPRVELGPVLSEEVSSSEPRNILLVGIDNAVGLDEDDPARIGRSDSTLLTDTMMVLRVEPGDEDASVLSIPRDLWVPIADIGTSAKINSALPIGGASTLITTIQDYLDIPIHNYIQVDFVGFQGVIAQIGGVPICIDNPIRDLGSALLVEEAGCQVLDAPASLAYVRSRKLEEQIDGQWVSTDQRSDLDRIDRQQDFLVAALQQGVARGLRNPITLARLVDSAEGSLTLDEILTPQDLIDLGSEFRNFDPDTLGRYTLPVVGDTVNSLSVLRMVEAEAQPVLDIFRGVKEGQVASASVRVRVLNGTGEVGIAAAAAAELEALGFVVADRGDADSFDQAATLIRHGPNGAAAAELLATAIAGPTSLVPTEPIIQADVELIIGADWVGFVPSA